MDVLGQLDAAFNISTLKITPKLLTLISELDESNGARRNALVQSRLAHYDNRVSAANVTRAAPCAAIAESSNWNIELEQYLQSAGKRR